MPSQDLYIDEEDCLGAELFASELELLVGSIKLRGRLDQVQLLELLPKLAATIPKADRATLKALQRKCEPAFTEMIGLGVCTTVRRLIAICLTRFYMHGDALGIYSQVHNLQTALNTREQVKGGSTWQMLLGGAGASTDKNASGEVGGISDGVRAGMLDLLAHLSLHHGRFLASAAATNMVISKNGSKSNSKAVCVAALRLAAATVEGLHPMDRAAPDVQADAFALFQRIAKEQGRCVDTQAAAAALISAIARGGGSALWRDGCYYWEEALRLCTTRLSHASQAVRDGYALALCDLSVVVSHEVLADVIAAEKRAAKKAALVRLRGEARGEVLQKTLVQPLVSAALQGSGAVCASLSLAWTSYIAWVAAKEGDAVLVDLAVQVVQLCDAATAKAQSEPHALAGPSPETHLGEALASGELPHIQACALYILRSAVIEALTESSQKALLHQLVGLLVRPSCAVPTAVVALEGLSSLMDILGEVGEEEGGTILEAAIMLQMPSPSAAIRHQAAFAAAALAAVQPPSAARLLTSVLDTLEAATQLMQEARPAQAAAFPPAFTTLMVKPPTVLMATAHGAALAAAGLLMVAAHLPLSVPSILPRRAYALATQLIRQPNSNGVTTRCSEREAGYIVLGALICSWEGAGEEAEGYMSQNSNVNSSLAKDTGVGGPRRAGRTTDIQEEGNEADDSMKKRGVAAQAEDTTLGLLSVAAGSAAREDLGETLCNRPNGDTDLSMQLRWRSVALQALHAYILALHAKGHQAETAQMKRVSTCLSQLLSVVESQRYLQEPVRATGGPSGILAAEAALFQLRLLQCAHLVPINLLPPSCQNTLIKLCSYPVKMATIAMCGSLSAAEAALPPPSLLGLQTGAMEVLYQAVLRHVLETEDAVLGPWLLGRDTAEDELHAFAGEQGGPHQLPWELPLVQAFYMNMRGRGHSPNPGSSSSVSQGFLWLAAPSAAASSGSASHSAKEAGGIMRGTLYPQPIGLGPALLTAQVAVLGQLLPQVSQQVQLNILDDCIQCASAGKAGAVRRVGKDGITTMVTTTNATTTPGLTPTELDAAARRLGAGTLAAIVALSGLMPLVKQPPSVRAAIMGSGETADKVAGRVLQLANALLDGGGASEPGIARAGAQILAASACLGSDSWAGKVVSALGDEVTGSVADGRDKQRRSALCLALCCVHRTKGGLVLQALIPSSTAALVAAARHPADSDIALWALHSLTTMAQSTGPGYLQHVHSTFTLCRELLVGGYDAPGLRPMCARLANAMVGVLGPEFRLGSQHYAAAKSLITDMGQAGVLAVDDPPALAALCSVGSSTDPSASNSSSASSQDAHFAAPRPIPVEALACELQAVLFAQQLILFAPKAIQASKHVPMLQITLLSRRPALRKAAAATLRHLAERDPNMLLAARLEGALFASLDGEVNAAIAGQLRATLEALLVVGAPQRPSYWLACLAEVVFSSGAKTGSGHDAAGAGVGYGSGSEKEDEEEPEDEGGAEDDGSGDEDVKKSAGGAEGKGRLRSDLAKRSQKKAGTEGGAGKKKQTELAAPANGGGGDDKEGKKKGAKTKADARGAAAAAAAKAGMEGAGAMQVLLATVALRLRTRVFAAELVHRMLQVAEQRCAADPLELVPTQALARGAYENQEGPGDSKANDASPRTAPFTPHDKMVDHLQGFIEVGYKISIGPVEALKPCGVWLLHAVLKVYGSVEDPLLPGARLLENHQAHLVGALRASLAPATPAAGPVLAIAGGQLATTFLESGLAAGDSKVMKRLLELLTSPLASASGLRAAGGAYAEWVGTVHTLALLQAHAQCAAIARHEGNELVLEEVSAAHEPHRALLCSLWAAVLQDHAILVSQPPRVLRQYPSALLMTTSNLADQLGGANNHDSSSSSNSSSSKATREDVLPSQAASAMAAALNGPSDELPRAAHLRVHRGFRSMAAAAAQAGRGGDGSTHGVIISSQVMHRVRASYAAAAPVALRALGLGYFPDAQHVADSVRGESHLHRQYCMLLDVAMMLVHYAAQGLADSVQACFADGGSKEGSNTAACAAALENCVMGLHGLMGPAYLRADLVEGPVLLQALRELEGLTHCALAPMLWAAATKSTTGWVPHLAALVTAISGFLKELAQGMPAHLLSAPLPSTNPSADEEQASSNNGTSFSSNVRLEGSTDVPQGSSAWCGAEMCRAFVDAVLAAASITTPFTLLPASLAHAQAAAAEASAAAAAQSGGPAPQSRSPSTQDTSTGPLSVSSPSLTGEGCLSCVPLLPPPGMPASSQAAADTALVALLVAAQALVRKADQQHHNPEPITELLPPFLQLSVRLILTAPQGVQLQAAHRFFDSHILLACSLTERIASSSSTHSEARASSACNASSSSFSKGSERGGLDLRMSSRVLAAAAEQAVLCVARALHVGVRDLRQSGEGSSSSSSRAESRRFQGDGQERGSGPPNTQGEASTRQDAARARPELGTARFRIHGPVCLAGALTACAHLSCATHASKAPPVESSHASGPGANASEAPASTLCAYVLSVVTEVLRLPGSCNHPDASNAGTCEESLAADSHSTQDAEGSSTQYESEPSMMEAANSAANAEAVDALQAKAAEGLRVALQEAGAADASAGKMAWAEQLLSLLGPLVTELAHSRLQANTDAQHQRHQAAAQSSQRHQQSSCLVPLSAGSVVAVSESVKALVAAAHFTGVVGGSVGQEVIVQVLLHLLVLAAAPPLPALPTLSLKELAVKLVTSLPGSPMGGPIKAAVSALPSASKQRLQAALKEPEVGLVAQPSGSAVLSSGARHATVAGAAAARPTIQLKTTFAISR